MLRLLGLFGQTWRSVFSVVLAYGIIILLFFYNDGALAQLLDVASISQDQLKELIGQISPKGEFLFGTTISDGTVFATMMILASRIAVMPIFLWVAGLLTDRLFGRN